jgi:PST family polysaccharide transporter/lipopolysaccharide exporter
MIGDRIIERVKAVSNAGGSLTQRSVVGGAWVAALNVSDRVLQLAMVVVLARLIGPEAFGLMGIALLALAAFRTVSRLGLDEALVYNENENIDDYLDTTLTLNIGRGVLVGSAAYLSAPLVATLLGEPRATPVLEVLALTPVLQGLRNPGIVYFRKDLEFHREYVYKVSGAVAQLVVAVGYALVFPTVWALVAGTIAKKLVRVGVSYWIHPYRPWPRFDVDRARELIDYGKWMTGASIMGFLTKQGDDAFLAWLLGATSLGLYQMAYRLAKAPNTEVTHVVSRVAFPAYSKLQDDMEKLRAGFYRTIKVTLLVSFPAGVGVLAVAPTFVRAFLGESWMAMVPTMQLLALYGMSVSFGSMFGEIWKAVGRPDLITKFGVVRIVVFAALIYPLTVRYGILGTALTIVAAEALLRPLSLVVTARLVDASVFRMVRELFYPLVASAGMGAAVWSLQRQLALGYPMVEFGILVVTGVLTYAALVVLLETQFGWGLRAEYRSIRRRLGGGSDVAG